MASLSHTFVECSLIILGTKKVDASKNLQLARVIETLDLSPSNLAVGLIYLHKYEGNSVNSLDCSTDAESLHYYIIIASLILANKFLNDSSYTVKTWLSILYKCSKVFRPSLQMLNQLESHVLAALDFALNTRHDPRLWALLQHNPHRTHVTQLRMAVSESACVPQLCEPKAAAPPSYCFGLATPPSAFTIFNSPTSVTPSPGAPYTPLSLCLPQVGSQFVQIYPSPLVGRTPQYSQHSSKRRKVCRSACGGDSHWRSHSSSHIAPLLTYDF